MRKFLSHEASQARGAAAAVPVADTITIFRAVSERYASLVDVYGPDLIGRLYETARDDMWAAMRTDDEDRRPGLEASLKDLKQLAETAKKFKLVPLVQETGAVDVVGLNSTEARVTDVQELIDDFDMSRYHRRRANVPLMWWLPVRQAVEVQARYAHLEDDRLRAVELCERMAPSPYVEHVAATLAATAVAEEALLQ